MFNVTRKKSDTGVHQQSNCVNKEKPKFVKCVSITRLFGNAYSTHQHMSQKSDNTSPVKPRILFKNRNSNVPNKLKIERFKNRSESQIDHMGTDCTDFCKPDKLPIEDFCDEKDLGTRAFRTISKGLGLIWRRSYSVEISSPDPEYKVFYLGNVLTGWAKGTCVCVCVCFYVSYVFLYPTYLINHIIDWKVVYPNQRRRNGMVCLSVS